MLNVSTNKQSQKQIKYTNAGSEAKNNETIKTKLMNIQFMDQPYKLAINNRFMSHRKTYSNTKKQLKLSSRPDNRFYNNESFNLFLDDNI